jgi:hypothetical protein
MRPLFATPLVALAATTVGASGAAPPVTVAVTPSAPPPEGSARTPSGRRDYGVSFRVTVNADEECANLVVTYSYVVLFNGRRSLAGSTTAFYETKAPARTAAFDVHAVANAADVVSFSATGSCEDADGNAIATSPAVVARTTVPSHSCNEGPLHVYTARGAVRREDLLTRAARPQMYAATNTRAGSRRRARLRCRVGTAAGRAGSPATRSSRWRSASGA